MTLNFVISCDLTTIDTYRKLLKSFLNNGAYTHKSSVKAEFWMRKWKRLSICNGDSKRRNPIIFK